MAGGRGDVGFELYCKRGIAATLIEPRDRKLNKAQRKFFEKRAKDHRKAAAARSACDQAGDCDDAGGVNGVDAGDVDRVVDDVDGGDGGCVKDAFAAYEGVGVSSDIGGGGSGWCCDCGNQAAGSCRLRTDLRVAVSMWAKECASTRAASLLHGAKKRLMLSLLCFGQDYIKYSYCFFALDLDANFGEVQHCIETGC